MAYFVMSNKPKKKKSKTLAIFTKFEQIGSDLVIDKRGIKFEKKRNREVSDKLYSTSGTIRK